VLGEPEGVTAYDRRTFPQRDGFLDNQLAVLEYPRAMATIRCVHTDPFGFQRRQFVVVGDRGSIEIRPLEPPKLTLALDQNHGEYEKGRRQVELPEMPGRYDAQLIHLADAIRGKVEPAFGPTHDLAAHEAVLRASGLPVE
jgi:predicted dehydrogenase